MAFCANCGTEVSDSRTTCANCGHPMGTAVAAAVPGTLQYADFWSRFAAFIIDALILLLPTFAFGGGRLFGGFVVAFVYHWLLIAYWNGQTVGKRVLNIRITRPDGSPVDPGAAAARSAMRIVSGIPLGLGFLWAAWDADKRTWHDAVADTRAYRA